MIFDKKFNQSFKTSSRLRKKELINDLSQVFLLPENHHTRSVLNRYYYKYPRLFFDESYAKEVLGKFFEHGSNFIIDYAEPFRGGYQKNYLNVKLNEAELNDANEFKLANSNWFAFVDKLEREFWEDNNNKIRLESLGEYKFYENRMPTGLREKYLSAKTKTVIDGLTTEISYSLFDNPEIMIFISGLIGKFYPEFEFSRLVSNKNIGRYAKYIGHDLYLGICFDFKRFNSELNHSYLEFPRMRIECFSKELNKPIKEDAYLKEPHIHPIRQIDVYYFMGNLLNNRIGNSSNDEEILKRRLFYYFEVTAHYWHIYLRNMELCVIEALN